MGKIKCCCDTPTCETLCSSYLPTSPWLVSYSIGNGAFVDSWTDVPMTRSGTSCNYIGNTCDIDTMVEDGAGTYVSNYPGSVPLPTSAGLCCKNNRVEIYSQEKGAYQIKLARFSQLRYDTSISVAPVAPTSSLLRVSFRLTEYRYVNWNYLTEYVTGVRFLERIISIGSPCTFAWGDVSDWCQYDLSGSLTVPQPPLDGAFLGGDCPNTAGTPHCEWDREVCGQTDFFASCADASRTVTDVYKYRCQTSKQVVPTGIGGNCYILGIHNCFQPTVSCSGISLLGQVFERNWLYASDPFDCSAIPATVVVKRTPYSDIAAVSTPQSQTCSIVGTSDTVTVNWTVNSPFIPKEFTVTL